MVSGAASVPHDSRCNFPFFWHNTLRASLDGILCKHINNTVDGRKFFGDEMEMQILIWIIATKAA